MVKLKLFLVFIIYSFLVQAQTIKTNDFANINLDDVVDIKGVIYNKLDSSLVTGKVIRYNRKKEAKRYIIVREGRPDELGWIYANDKNYEQPKPSGLGTLIKAAAVTTGLVMEVSRNNIDVPFPDSHLIENDNSGLIETEITPLINYNKEIARTAHDEMLKRNEIAKNIETLQSNERLYNKFYEDGQLKEIGKLVDGKKEGEWKTYYDSGQLSGIQNYQDGLDSGEWKSYYENGKLSEIKNYLNDRLTGERKFYDDKGNLKRTINYD